MGLEDFEKELLEEKKREKHSRHHKDGEKKSHRHHERSHREHRHHRKDERSRSRDSEHRHKRRKHDDDDKTHKSRKHRSRDSESPKRGVADEDERPKAILKRDSWMEAPPTDVAYIRRQNFPQDGIKKLPSAVGHDQKLHDHELTHHHVEDDRDSVQEEREDENDELPVQHAVTYTFGDAGSGWRMTKLRGIYKEAESSKKDVEEVAMKQYGSLQLFDDAREEQEELERRKTYGKGYVGKEKPSGDLYQERKLKADVHSKHQSVRREASPEQSAPVQVSEVSQPEVKVDQSQLNKLKAAIMKAKLKKSADLPKLEAEYAQLEVAMREQNDAGPDVVVLGPSMGRALAGARNEVKAVDNKRGRERQLVKENEDMSIQDMVQEEKRTSHQRGGEGKKLAERIAGDSKFTDDLDYMDENATRLASRKHQSEINFRNTNIADYHKKNKILDSCQLCPHEDTETPPIAPVLSTGTRVYLTLATEPEMSPGGACIVPLEHHTNLIDCDDDEWEEIRNFMKSLTRMYHAQNKAVIFYENAAFPNRMPHAAMMAVPLPFDLGDTAPAYFRESFMASDSEWSQHKKIIDTLANARNGQGRSAFRRSVAKEAPYFHVWFELDGGMGHVVEDPSKWPKGDVFAREIIAGMLGVGLEKARKQGRWEKADRRVDGFRKKWKPYDWTRVLE